MQAAMNIMEGDLPQVMRVIKDDGETSYGCCCCSPCCTG